MPQRRRGSGTFQGASSLFFSGQRKTDRQAVRLPCVFILGGRKRIGLGVPFADSYFTQNFLQNYEVLVNSL
jgi:hypothetical protein